MAKIVSIRMHIYHYNLTYMGSIMMKSFGI